jgi:hypothetical protein
VKQPGHRRLFHRARHLAGSKVASRSPLILAAFLISACGGPDSEFAAGCDRQGFTDEQCGCLHDLVTEQAGEDVYELFVAQMLEDEGRAKAVRDKLGFVSGARVLAELGMLLQRAPSACPGV